LEAARLALQAPGEPAAEPVEKGIKGGHGVGPVPLPPARRR
jgi:hypothetical protein